MLLPQDNTRQPAQPESATQQKLSLSGLPDDLLGKTIGYFGPNEMLQLAVASKQMSALCWDDQVVLKRRDAVGHYQQRHYLLENLGYLRKEFLEDYSRRADIPPLNRAIAHAVSKKLTERDRDRARPLSHCAQLS